VVVLDNQPTSNQPNNEITMNFKNLYDMKQLALASVNPLFIQKLWETPERLNGTTELLLVRYMFMQVNVVMYESPYTPKAITSLAAMKLRVELHLPCGLCQTGHAHDVFELPNADCINGDLYASMSVSLIPAIHEAFCPVGIAELYEYTQDEYRRLNQMVA
jgi:hypothetical protein